MANEAASDPLAALISGSAERMAKLSEEGFDAVKRNNGFALDRVRRNANVALAMKLGFPVPNPLDEPVLPEDDTKRPTDVPAIDEETKTA